MGDVDEEEKIRERIREYKRKRGIEGEELDEKGRRRRQLMEVEKFREEKKGDLVREI